MEGKDLGEKIKRETEKLNGLRKKKADIDGKIKACESNLEKYTLIQEKEQYLAIQKATEGAGVSVEDVLAALQSGDMTGLQERMEAAKEQGEGEEPESVTG